MYRLEESKARLNRHAVLLESGAITFRVNYWGGMHKLTYNPVHKHSSFEICYVLDGDGTYLDDGRLYHLRKGTLFCSRPGIAHQIRSGEGLFLLWVDFEVDESRSSSEYVERFVSLAGRSRVCVNEGDGSSAASLWRSLLIPEQESWAVDTDYLPALAHTLLVSFLGLFLNEKQSLTTDQLRPNLILQRAKSFIRDNFDKELSLGMIAQYLNVSERHLSRLFSEGINESFITFIRKERVRRAAFLLKTTDLSIKEIAEATGFGTVHYFTRVFAAEKDVPPGRFRSSLDA